MRKIRKFSLEDLWHIPFHQKSKSRSFLVRQLRILILAVKGFMENRVSLWASALTFYTMLSVVPIVAMAFGVAKGFGFTIPWKISSSRISKDRRR